MGRRGTRLRIALTTDGAAEPFLIHAKYEIKSRIHVYEPDETEAVITDALRATGSTCREFLDEATEAGGRRTQTKTPVPTIWDEPAFVIGGMAPGTVAHWRERRRQGNTPQVGTR